MTPPPEGARPWLAIETATDRASVAVGTSALDAATEELSGARRHAAALLPMVERVLARRGIALDALAGVAISDGPGSFTGLRVGAAVAKGLHRACGFEVRTAASLLVRAVGVAHPGEMIVAVANALRGEVFVAAYRFAEDRVETLVAPRVARPDLLPELLPRPDRVVGDAPPPLLASLEAWAGRAVIRPPEGAPRAAGLLALLRLADGTRRIDDVPHWEPDYGRPAEAQARWELAHGRPLPNSPGDLR